MQSLKSRRSKLLLLLISSFFCFLSLVSPVYAQDVDLDEWPDAMADRFGISAFASGILLTVVLEFAVCLPIAVFAKNQGSMWLAVLTFFFIAGFSVAIGWLDYWLMLMAILLVAGMYSVLSGKIFK